MTGIGTHISDSHESHRDHRHSQYRLSSVKRKTAIARIKSC